MPKSKTGSRVARLRAVVDEFETEGIITNGIELLCRYCAIVIQVKRSQITQHIGTVKHRKNKETKFRFQMVEECDNERFSTSLCRAFLSADIPLWKLTNPVLKEFLETFTGKRIPDESTLRKNYVLKTYECTLHQIRNEIKDGPIWICIDETTDPLGRFIVNVVIGRLSSEEYTPPFLLNSVEVDKTNHQTITKVFNDSMQLLWPIEIMYSRVFLFLSDATPYMIEVASSLQMLYTQMTHMTCIAHALHRVAEKIRFLYPETNDLISTVKKIFCKAPTRIQKFKELFPKLDLPPEPIVTPWGTWLSAAEYYSDNFNFIRTIINTLDADSETIKHAKKMFENTDKLRSQLCKIKENYVFLIKSIDKLQTKGLTLQESLNIVIDAITKMTTVPDSEVKEEMQTVLKKNPGLTPLTAISKGDIAALKNFKQFNDMSPTDLAAFKYAPITSCDVERSFIVFKSILHENRRSFTFDKLRMHLIICCNGK